MSNEFYHLGEVTKNEWLWCLDDYVPYTVEFRTT